MKFQALTNSTSEDWLQIRATGIGASEIAAVLGISPWQSPLSLFVEKVGTGPPTDLSNVEAVEWGVLLEPVIVAQFQRRTGRNTKKSGELLRSAEHPWALCTLDSWTWSDTISLRPLEVKLAHAFKADEWENGPPDHYMAQLQQQMLVTGSDHATIACLLGGQRLVWCDVERDETWIRKIIHHGSRFWDRVQNLDPPEPDESDASARVLKLLFPEDNGETVVLPTALRDTVDEWQELKARRHAVNAQIQYCENKIKATLGEAERGIFPSGAALSWKLQHRREHVTPATSFRVLRYHAGKEQ